MKPLPYALRADLFLLRSANPDAYAALVQTGAAGIGLVLVEGLPVYGDAPLSDSEISLRRNYPDQVQRVGTCVPSQPHGSPALLVP